MKKPTSVIKQTNEYLKTNAHIPKIINSDEDVKNILPATFKKKQEEDNYISLDDIEFDIFKDPEYLARDYVIQKNKSLGNVYDSYGDIPNAYKDTVKFLDTLYSGSMRGFGRFVTDEYIDENHYFNDVINLCTNALIDNRINVVSINNIIGYYGGMRKTQKNLGNRNFLFEMDKGLSVKEQLHFWLHIPFKPTLLTYSGNKSLHAIYCVDDEYYRPFTQLEYKNTWKRLAHTIEYLAYEHIHGGELLKPLNKLVYLDSSTIDSSKYTRIPSGLHAKTDKRAKLIKSFPRSKYSKENLLSLVTNNKWIWSKYLKTIPRSKFKNQENVPIHNIIDWTSEKYENTLNDVGEVYTSMLYSLIDLQVATMLHEDEFDNEFHQEMIEELYEITIAIKGYCNRSKLQSHYDSMIVYNEDDQFNYSEGYIRWAM